MADLKPSCTRQFRTTDVWRSIVDGHWIQPAVAPTRQRFDVLGSVWVIAECLAKLGDRHPKAVVAIADAVVGPHPFAKFVSGNYFAGVLQQYLQYAERLVLQPEDFSISTQLSCPNHELEFAKPKCMIKLVRGPHRWHRAPLCSVSPMIPTLTLGGKGTIVAPNETSTRRLGNCWAMSDELRRAAVRDFSSTADSKSKKAQSDFADWASGFRLRSSTI